MIRSTFIGANASFAEKRGRLSTLVARNPNKTIYAREVAGGIEVSVRPSGFRVLVSKHTVERKECNQSRAAALALLQELDLVPKEENIKSKARRNAYVKLATDFDKVAVMVEQNADSIYGFTKDDHIIGYSSGSSHEKRPVVTATRMSDDKRVVVKTLPDNQASLMEIGMLEALGKPENTNIVQYHGKSYANGEFRVVMENCPNGTLEQLGDEIDRAVADDKLTRLEGDRMRLLLWQDTVRGAEQMGEQGVTHRDFRRDNCFIDADWVVKVGDFGTSDQRVRLNTDVQSDVIECKSPELLRGMEVVRNSRENRNKVWKKIRSGELKSDRKPYTLDDLPRVSKVSVMPSSDMWSVGVIGYKSYCKGAVPFSNTGMGYGGLLIDEIKGFSGTKVKFPDDGIPLSGSEVGRVAAENRKKLRDEVEVLVRKCLSKKPGHRPTPQNLLADPVWKWIGGEEGERELRSKMSRLFSKRENLPTHS
jgi:serine/threonine protein kinase